MQEAWKRVHDFDNIWFWFSFTKFEGS
jgi:hypothetical protein